MVKKNGTVIISGRHNLLPYHLLCPHTKGPKFPLSFSNELQYSFLAYRHSAGDIHIMGKKIATDHGATPTRRRIWVHFSDLNSSCSSKEYIRPEKSDQAERFKKNGGVYNMTARGNLGCYNSTFKRHQGDSLLFSLSYIQTNRGD